MARPATCGSCMSSTLRPAGRCAMRSCAGFRTAASRFPPVRTGGCPQGERIKIHNTLKTKWLWKNRKSWKNALPLGAVAAGVRNGEARRRPPPRPNNAFAGRQVRCVCLGQLMSKGGTSARCSSVAPLGTAEARFGGREAMALPVPPRQSPGRWRSHMRLTPHRHRRRSPPSRATR